MQYEEYYFGLQLLRGPDALGPGRRSTTRSRSDGVLRPPEPRQPDHVHDGRSRTRASPTRSCPGVPDDKVYDEQTNPDGVRCTLQDYMVNAFGRDDDGFARRGFDNVGVQYGLKGLRDGRDLAGAVRRLQHAASAAPTSTSTSPPERTAADPIALERAVPDRRDRLGEQPRQGRDHRPARAGPRRVPRRLPDLRDARAAPAQLRHRRQPGALARPGAADRRPVVRRRRGVRRWTAGSRGCTPTAAGSRWRGRSSRTSPTRRATLHGRQPATTSRRACATRRSRPTARRAMAAGGPMSEDVMKCQLEADAARRLPGHVHGRRSGSGSRRRSPAASATTRSPA